jgi:hypothetical protein
MSAEDDLLSGGVNTEVWNDRSSCCWGHGTAHILGLQPARWSANCFLGEALVREVDLLNSLPKSPCSGQKPHVQGQGTSHLRTSSSREASPRAPGAPGDWCPTLSSTVSVGASSPCNVTKP